MPFLPLLRGAGRGCSRSTVRGFVSAGTSGSLSATLSSVPLVLASFVELAKVFLRSEFGGCGAARRYSVATPLRVSTNVIHG